MSIVYKKEDAVENEDVWDDTELIKMYEDCVSATYTCFPTTNTLSTSSCRRSIDTGLLFFFKGRVRRFFTFQRGLRNFFRSS
ncbi:hypothetical protein Y032_0086g1979 [Ancylostoma ceylanicum]|uniref:Survival Motor Neuron Gemin2-binding domain-containing protein n=1 Tax=Ancylostoma ceylanicum TaxID=53326 RepID=A0A016TP25_9BILA|nr:hypothetical protein Y032_0086g1979 [Ancylostoma ceylanicum]